MYGQGHGEAMFELRSCLRMEQKLKKLVLVFIPQRFPLWVFTIPRYETIIMQFSCLKFFEVAGYIRYAYFSYSFGRLFFVTAFFSFENPSVKSLL